MKAVRHEPFECVTITRDIPTELEAELDPHVDPVVAIFLHSEDCWKMRGDSLPCPDRPEYPPDDPPHGDHPLVDEYGAHILLETNLCDEIEKIYPQICWFAFEELFYNMDNPS